HRPAGRCDPAADRRRPAARGRAGLYTPRACRSLRRRLPDQPVVPMPTSGRAPSFLPGHDRGKTSRGTGSQAEWPQSAATLEADAKAALRMLELETPWGGGLAPGGPPLERQASTVQPPSLQKDALASPFA